MKFEGTQEEWNILVKKNEFPRRNQLDKCTPAELTIFKAMEEVEKVGSDVRLTGAITKLNEAKNLVADFIDGIEQPSKKAFHWNFGQAIEALKQGNNVSRAGWNGKGMFIFMRPADELSADFIVNKVKSLPKSVKDYYSGKFHDPNNNDAPVDPENVMVKFTAYLCMKAADGTIVNGWLASQTDMLAEDWQLVE